MLHELEAKCQATQLEKMSQCNVIMIQSAPETGKCNNIVEKVNTAETAIATLTESFT